MLLVYVLECFSAPIAGNTVAAPVIEYHVHQDLTNAFAVSEIFTHLLKRA